MLCSISCHARACLIWIIADEEAHKHVSVDTNHHANPDYVRDLVSLFHRQDPYEENQFSADIAGFNKSKNASHRPSMDFKSDVRKTSVVQPFAANCCDAINRCFSPKVVYMAMCEPK